MKKLIATVRVLLLMLPLAGRAEDIYYTLTVNGGSGSGSYTNGTKVPISFDLIIADVWPSPEVTFIAWTGDVQYVESATSAVTVVTMPATNITLTAVCTISYPPPPYGYGDQDGDGQSDADEYIAGTNPTNPASYFRMMQRTRDVVSWDAVSGRVYSVYWMTNLLSGFQCLESNISWPRNAFTNSLNSSVGFYKIDVRILN